ncbi:hypothetical protein [Nitrogeniibacter aestuarii]|uniref:hypothetical protein n=1 Tax=Nitrogeniibacter aestuarii TaxID=2815343 RepID=UPI001E34980B|nr:hypothetical protein [Nitrogeniibacter aestuarii]
MRTAFNLVPVDEAQPYLFKVAAEIALLDGPCVYLVSDGETDTSEELFVEVDEMCQRQVRLIGSCLYRCVTELHRLGHVVRVWDAGEGVGAPFNVVECTTIEEFEQALIHQAPTSSYRVRLSANKELNSDALKRAG